MFNKHEITRNACHVFFGLVFVELEYALHLDFHEPQDVVFGDFADHLGIPWGEAFVNPCAGFVHALGVLKLLVFIDALLDEYLFETHEMELFEEFALAYLAFLTQ